jgi:hypothetical protein
MQKPGAKYTHISTEKHGILYMYEQKLYVTKLR